MVDTTWLVNSVVLDGAGPALIDALLARDDVRLLQADTIAALCQSDFVGSDPFLRLLDMGLMNSVACLS